MDGKIMSGSITYAPRIWKIRRKLTRVQAAACTQKTYAKKRVNGEICGGDENLKLC